MGCLQTLDFQTPPVTGAHLSYYWTMDEGGAVPKLDSTVGLAWPLRAGTLAAPGLFSNGTEFSPAAFGGHGLALLGTPDITINQATSTGVSMWFWMKILAYGGAIGAGVILNLDTSDVLHTNRIKLTLGFTDALNGLMELDHTNDTDDVFVDTPNLTWNVGAWHMVAITYDKTIPASLNIYIDGALSATVLDPFTYPDLTNADFFFRNLIQAAGDMDIVVDEFGLSTKGALTPAQITSLYNSGTGKTWPNITPIVPYP